MSSSPNLISLRFYFYTKRLTANLSIWNIPVLWYRRFISLPLSLNCREFSRERT